MDVEEVKKIIKTLSWKKLKDFLEEHPLESMDDAVQLCTHVYQSDRMVRRRATDDGKQRDKFLNSLTAYLAECGYSDVANEINEARKEFSVIDAGYSAIFDLERRLPTAGWTSEKQVSSAMTLLSSTVKQIEQDIDRSIEKAKAVVPEQEILDPDGNRYNPNGVFHGLAIATGNIIMMEAYRSSWFTDADEILLPQLPTVDELDAYPIQGNFATASNWRQWKSADEKARFLGGKVRLIDGVPDWAKELEIPPAIHIKQALEFDANVGAEVYCVLASERFDERQRQSLVGLITQTNLVEKIAEKSAVGNLTLPAELLSFTEAHASETLYRALSVPLEEAELDDLTVAELLRGYALLHAIAEQFYRESSNLFPLLTQTELTERLTSNGLTDTAAHAFIRIATFKRSSRDLYDAPLIRCAGDTLMLFGWTMLHADLTKITLSSISALDKDIDDKGSSFEKRVIEIFEEQGFDAKNIKVKRGADKAIYDYDVVLSWDDYVFLFECKNRSLPGDNPIAIYYFNHSIESHVKQVQRLRKGLEEYPDILSEHYPSAVGKKQVFCVVHGLPYAQQPIDDIHFSDQSLIQRFFESPTLGVVVAPLKKNTGVPPKKLELARIWAGTRPTAEEFARYLADPPQIRIAASHYQNSNRAEYFSDTVIVKFNDLHRVGASVEEVAAAIKSSTAKVTS
ncbi:hypothetical protein CSQ94_27165 [Janthinobacterium sp. BJB312]|nr:hypothetical protein CSQ94_27165 [Janthinobacterium sp. BJB312]